MAVWNVRVEYMGYDIEDSFDFPEDFTEEDVFDIVLNDIQIDLTKEA